MAKLLAFEALDISKVPRLPLPIIGVSFAAVRVVVIILHEDDVARGCTYAVVGGAVPPEDDGVVHLCARLWVLVVPHQIGFRQVLN